MAEVIGNITLELEDESSDSSDDESPHASLPREDINPVDNDNSDEELEVFGEKKVTRLITIQSAVVNPNDSQKKAETNSNDSIKEETNPLLAAMSTVISKIENGVEPGFGEPAFEVPAKKDERNNQTASEGVSDAAFGIPYKPFKKQELGYNMPKAAVRDEPDEFDFDDSAPVAAAAAAASRADADNEFDFDDIPENVGKQAISEAVARAATRVESIVVSNYSEEEDSAVEPVAKPEAEQPQYAKFDVRKAAKDAFSDIASVYSVGLGDAEIRLLEEAVDSTEQRKPTKLDTALTVSETIEECDEEEVEREELEVELREKEEKITMQLQKDSLEAEWDAIVSESNSDVAVGESREGDSDVINVLSCVELIAYLQSSNLSQYLSLITTRSYAQDNQGWFAKLSMSSIPALDFESSEELLQFPFLVAQLSYEPSNVVLRRSLQSIYKGLLPAETLCPTNGVHWDKIGFQGLDPRTDVNRSMKMLAILQMLHLVETQPMLACKLHKLSQHGDTYDPNMPRAQKRVDRGAMAEDLTWPFMCVSINFTKDALQTLRSGILNKKCNKRKDVMSVLFDFHHGLFYEFGKRLVAEPGKHHAIHLSELTKFMSSNPVNILQLYKKGKQTGFPETLEHTAVRSKVSVSSGAKETKEAKVEVAKFDTFEEIEKRIANDGPSTEKGPTGSKASKFKV